MQLTDVNILVHAFRDDSSDHAVCHKLYADMLNSPSAFGYCDVVLTGFIRIVTHSRIFSPPSKLDKALAFVNQLRGAPNAILIAPKERHWPIFEDLCREIDAKGADITDVYLTALAIESGCEWISADKGFKRFPGLKWQNPLS